jgi:signal recognition particle subunit SRP54
MFDNLSEKLERALKTLKGQGKITEINVAETLKEVRKALLDADVNFKVAKTFTDSIKEKALGQNVLTAVSPSQLLVKITHDELTQLMGGQMEEIFLGGNPTIIMMSGLQGSGKTTFTGKLANFLKTKKGKKPLLVACDVYRPAAIDQLHVLGEQIGVDVFSNKEEKNPIKIAQAAIVQAKENGNSIVLIDTAGRLAIDEQMMNEIADLKKAINPNEILFVVDAMTGQDAVNTAKAFNDRLDFDGVVLTKLDGDAKAGAALSIVEVTGKPILFTSSGEKLTDFDYFYPERMASRILGLGDIATLAEQAKRALDGDSAKRLEEKFVSGQDFTLEDFLEQLGAMKKMGSMTKLLGMLPGANSAAMKKQIDSIDDNELVRTQAIVQSMTPGERRDPKILNGSRRARIALGSGRSVTEVNSLVDRFSAAQKAMKQMRSGGGLPAGMSLPGGMSLPTATPMSSPKNAPKKKSRSGNPAKRAAQEGR